MLFGPIFSADVVSSGRRARYFWLRVAYALLILLILGLCYAPDWNSGVPTIRSTAALAATFFGSFAALQISAILMLGPAFTAGSISTERERRTIEYLFATDLSNVEIVYGKFAAALLRMIVLLLVSLPILAIARLLGGIAGDRMLGVFVVTASTAVTVAALSITVSVWTPRARDAVIRTYLILFGLLVLPLVAGVIVSLLLNIPGANTGVWSYPLSAIAYVSGAITAGNPYTVVVAILAQDLSNVTLSAHPWELVGWLLLAQGLVTALCAILAPWGVRRVHLKAAGGAPPPKAEVARVPTTVQATIDDSRPVDNVMPTELPPVASSRGRSRSRRAVPDNWPMLWKELFAERSQSRFGIVGRIVLSLAVSIIVVTSLVVFYFYLREGSRDAGPAFQGYVAVMATLVTCGTLLLLAARGATSITTEKERDTWTALLGTPLEPREVILAKFWGTLYGGRWMIPLLGFLWLLGAVAYPYSVLGIPVAVLTIAILACFFSALGVAFSLRSSNSTRSLGATLAVCVALGGGYYLCCGCLMVPISLLGSSGLEDDLFGMLVMSPWPPFLTFAPHFSGMLFDSNLGGDFSDIAPFVTAYCAGNMAYLVGTAALLAISIADFNRVTGRQSESTRPPASSPPGMSVSIQPVGGNEHPLVAEVLEEPGPPRPSEPS